MKIDENIAEESKKLGSHANESLVAKGRECVADGDTLLTVSVSLRRSEINENK